MLRRKPSTRRVRPSAITAAGRRVDVTSERELKAIAARPLDWQRRSYNFYDPMSASALGEVWYAGRYVSESMSRLRLYAAVTVDPAAEPVPVDSQAALDFGVTDDEITVTQAAVARITGSYGGQADILRGATLNNFLAGESYVIGLTRDNQEQWEAHSVEALTRDGSGALRLLDEPQQPVMDGMDLTDAAVVHIWRKHPRFPALPDAAMGAALTYCEDLWTLTSMVRASARSRIPSGVFAIPNTATSQPIFSDEFDEDDPGAEHKDPFTEDLIKHFTEPLKDANDAAALVPFILRMDPDDIEKIKQFSFAREIDRLAVELRHEARSAFAATIDLPADVMTGKQGLNDWSAWNVDEETFRVHLAPHAELFVTGMTAGYFRPTIFGQVAEPELFCIWYDATELIVHPNKSENAKDAHDRLLISDEAARRDLGYTETDQPSDEERARRAPAAAGPPEVEAPAETVAPGGPENGPPTPEQPTEVQASAAQPTLGERLALIEQSLLQRLLAAADAEMRQALSRAGSRLVASARKRSTGEAVRQIVASTEKRQIAARLGPELVAALGQSSEQLLDGAFDDLAGRWDDWIAAAQHEALRLMEAAGHRMSADARARVMAKMAEDRAAGFAVFEASLIAAGVALLYTADQPSSLTAAGIGTALSPTIGENDTSRTVDASALRGSLSVAGGGVTPGGANEATTGGNSQSGVVSGETAINAMSDAGLKQDGWVWVYGDPSSRTTPFEPHADLDGETFDGWEDPLLTNDEPWPEGSFYFPGDHDGCQCTFAPNAVPDEEAVAEEPPTVEGFDLTVSTGRFTKEGTEIYRLPDSEVQVRIAPHIRAKMTDEQRDHFLRAVRATTDAGDGRAVNFILDDMPKAYANNGGAAARGGPEVLIHPGTVLERGGFSSDLYVTRNVAQGQITPAAAGHSSAEYIIAHEFGHTMDVAGAGTPLPSGFTPTSIYGATNRAESFAEAWAEWFLSGGKTANTAAQALARQQGWSF